MEIKLSDVSKELFINDDNFSAIERSIKRIRSWQEISGDLLEVLQVIGWYKYFNYHEQPQITGNSSSSDIEKFKEKTQWRLSLMKDYFGENNSIGRPNSQSLLMNINKPLELFIIITYLRIFSSSKTGGRAPLSSKSVFNNSKFKSKHENLKKIRDKLTAHAEWGSIDKHKQAVTCFLEKVEGKYDLQLINRINRSMYNKKYEINIFDIEECSKISYDYCLGKIEDDFVHLKCKVLSDDQMSKLINWINRA